jgi:hypothetical protein
MNFTSRGERISGLLGRDEFDALILVTQSPDHFMPPTSSIIQGRLNLKHDLFRLDINQGCRKGHLRLSAPSAVILLRVLRVLGVRSEVRGQWSVVCGPVVLYSRSPISAFCFPNFSFGFGDFSISAFQFFSVCSVVSGPFICVYLSTLRSGVHPPQWATEDGLRRTGVMCGQPRS